MAVVQSFGTLQAFSDSAIAPYAVDPYMTTAWDARALNTAYATLYRTQPNVRTVIDFLSRNIAQLGLHAYRRVSDTDRERLANHELIQWIEAPNPATTAYRLIESTMCDLGIYFNAFWLKVRLSNRIGLVRVPPETMMVQGWLQPSVFIWTTPDGVAHEVEPRNVVHFSGYDPCDPLMGLSPLETLRQLLAEDTAATTYQKAYWMNC